MKKIATLVAAATLAAPLGVCAAAPTTSPAALYGTYRVTLHTADPDVPNGLWTLRLRPGSYSIGVARGFTNTGTLHVSGNQLAFSRETAGCENIGRYHWRLTGRTLRLSVIGRDTCSGNDRTVVLTSRPWRHIQ